MKRVAVFSQNPREIESWQPWLEQIYEVTYVSTDQALKAIIETWQPHLLIYNESQVRGDFLLSFAQKSSPRPFGLIVVAQSYSLREELTAFEIGADHFLLVSSPIASVKARIASLITKFETRTLAPDADNLIALPQKKATVKYKNLTLYPEQNCVQAAGQTYRITPTQMRLILILLQNSGAVLSREWLRNHVFNDTSMSLRSIDAQLAKLKKAVPPLRNEIVSVYGKGYMLNQDEQKSA